MSNVVRLPVSNPLAGGMPTPGERDFYLGPAEVTAALLHEVTVRLPRGTVAQARLALAFPYEPRATDEVLVIGTTEGHYVIGVLRGTGTATLSFPADVELHAGGTLKLRADDGVAIEAPDVSVTTKKLQMIAAGVVQTFTSLRQRVTELLSTHAGQAHTVVEGSMHTQAKSATILTEGKVAINGKEVHLG